MLRQAHAAWPGLDAPGNRKGGARSALAPRFRSAAAVGAIGVLPARPWAPSPQQRRIILVARPGTPVVFRTNGADCGWQRRRGEDGAVR
jgi:hypothetical protein